MTIEMTFIWIDSRTGTHSKTESLSHTEWHTHTHWPFLLNGKSCFTFRQCVFSCEAMGFFLCVSEIYFIEICHPLSHNLFIVPFVFLCKQFVFFLKCSYVQEETEDTRRTHMQRQSEASECGCFLCGMKPTTKDTERQWIKRC